MTDELSEQLARVDVIAARIVKRIYPWWPLENLLNVAQGWLNTYVATWERDYGWTKITEYMVIPPEVIAEMTEGYAVFTVNMHDPDPWQPVADKINAAAQRCALRYMGRP